MKERKSDEAVPRVVKEYQSYCKESGFPALSRSTLLRILSIGSASTQKSLQGLDYVSSTGVQALEELLDVVEKGQRDGLGKGCAESATHWKVLPEGVLQGMH